VAYIAFARKIRSLAVQLSAELATCGDARKEWLTRKTLLKRIDECNYMKYTVPAMQQGRARRKAEAKA
jgi:hypothetical protein